MWTKRSSECDQELSTTERKRGDDIVAKNEVGRLSLDYSMISGREDPNAAEAEVLACANLAWQRDELSRRNAPIILSAIN